MAEESLSDVEADSEFEEVLSSKKQRQSSVLDSFAMTCNCAVRFWRANGNVQGLISKNRFDRPVQRLVPGCSCAAQQLHYARVEVRASARSTTGTAVTKGKDETVR